MAAEASGRTGNREAAPPARAVEERPGLEEALSWVGYKLDESGGRSAGRVEGVLVDAASGEPTWLAIKTGRLRGHSAVPIDLAAGGIGHVWVPYARETIRSSPEIEPGGGLDRDSEVRLCDHYGIPPGFRRRAALEGRADDGPTSVRHNAG